MYYRYVNASSQQYCMYWFLKYPFVEGDLRANENFFLEGGKSASKEL